MGFAFSVPLPGPFRYTRPIGRRGPRRTGIIGVTFTILIGLLALLWYAIAGTLALGAWLVLAAARTIRR